VSSPNTGDINRRVSALEKFRDFLNVNIVDTSLKRGGKRSRRKKRKSRRNNFNNSSAEIIISSNDSTDKDNNVTIDNDSIIDSNMYMIS
jgi:hypothetical protein